MTEQKRGRGRPESNDNEILTAILNNEDKRKEFVEAIENLVYHKRKIEADMLLHKEDVSAVSVRMAILLKSISFGRQCYNVVIQRLNNMQRMRK